MKVGGQFYPWGMSPQYALDWGLDASHGLYMTMKGKIPAPAGNWILTIQLVACGQSELSEQIPYNMH
jgi:hypothetical protein